MSKALFEKQRELLRRFMRKTRKVFHPGILRIATKVYSKKRLSKKELEVLKKGKNQK